MSIKIMSGIIATKFTELSDEAGNVSRAARLILPASFRRARDEGGGSQ